MPRMRAQCCEPRNTAKQTCIKKLDIPHIKYCDNMNYILSTLQEFVTLNQSQSEQLLKTLKLLRKKTQRLLSFRDKYDNSNA